MAAGLTSLSVDISQLEAVRRGLEGASKDMKGAILDAVGAELESSTVRRIDEEQASPDGQDWPIWSERYRETRTGQHSLLIGEGALINSITHIVDGRGFIDVGSNLIYAATHQFGDPDRNIPERPYLGVSASDENVVGAIIADVVADILGKRGLA